MIKEIYNKYIKIEKVYALFEKNTLGVYWWDIVRADIFNMIHQKALRLEPVKKTKSKNQIKCFIISFVKNIRYKRAIKNRQIKYLFFISSRDRNESGIPFDYISQELYGKVKEEAFIIESFVEAHEDNRDFVFYNVFIRVLKKMVGILLYRFIKLDINLQEIIYSQFELELDINKFIKRKIIEHKVESYLYFFLMKKYKPKKIFVIQNGIQKALFSTAKALDIPCYELQHGHMNQYHLLYNYPNQLGAENYNTLPLGILTFSSYWGGRYPVQEKIAIGNKIGETKGISTKGICVVFNCQNYKELINITQELAIQSKQPIYVKLHPIQYKRKQEINKIFQDRKVRIIQEECSMKEVYPKIESIVVIDSTCIYEALYMKKIVYVIKGAGYQYHEEVFKNKNVYIIDNVEEIDDNINRWVDSEGEQYYMEIQSDMIDKILDIGGEK